MNLLGLDIGTTSCKALLLSPGGDTLFMASEEYPLHYPGPGRVELDPYEVWEAISDLIRRAAKHSQGSIRAIAVSSHGESVTPVDRDGRALHNSITSLDTRATGLLPSFLAEVGKGESEKITNIPLHYKHSLFKYRWFREKEPKVFERTSKFLCYQDLITTWLGAEPAISPSLAARTMAFDSEKLSWSSKHLDYAGISAGMLPSITGSGEKVGQVSRKNLDDFGLKGPVDIVSGGHDQCCAMLGAGALGLDSAVDSIGTVEALMLNAPPGISSGTVVSRGYPVYPHVLRGRKVVMAVNPNAGSAMRWFRENISESAAPGENAYEAIVENCRGCQPGLIVLPFFAGRGTPDADPEAKALFSGMTLSTTRYDIAWAIFESMAFELRLNLEAMQQEDSKIEGMVAVGGGSKSASVVQLRADVLGIPVKLPRIKEAAALGAAILAGTGSGTFNSIEEAVRKSVGYDAHLAPDTSKRDYYEARFLKYCEHRNSRA